MLILCRKKGIAASILEQSDKNENTCRCNVSSICAGSENAEHRVVGLSVDRSTLAGSTPNFNAHGLDCPEQEGKSWKYGRGKQRSSVNAVDATVMQATNKLSK